jgi:hypothetical protein
MISSYYGYDMLYIAYPHDINMWDMISVQYIQGNKRKNK